MSKSRAMILFVILLAVIALRIWDPLGHTGSIGPASAPVIRPIASHAQDKGASGQQPPPTDQYATWPIRSASADKPAGNAFLTRAEVAQALAPKKPVQQVSVAPVFYGPPKPPPPPPPPVEPPPPLQVIGTWGGEKDQAVFLAGPQGTLLARKGDVVLSQYVVESINKQRVTLRQGSDQKLWTLPIPAAPSSPQTWTVR